MRSPTLVGANGMWKGSCRPYGSSMGGGLPRQLVTDRGPWYRTVSVVLAEMEHIQMTWGIRNLLESLFTQLKRQLASFAGYFQEGNVERVKERIWLGLASTTSPNST